MRIFANAAFPFLHWRRKAYIATAVMLLGGFAAMMANVFHPEIRSWLRYGVDFTGGTIIQLDFDQPTTVDQIRQAATGRGWEIFRFGAEDEFIVRMQTFDQTTDDAAAQVTAALEPVFGAGAFQIVRTEAVSPKVSEELQRKALVAILLSLGATLIYLAFRFEWRFGVAAVVATVHDIVITLGFLALIRSEISVGTVAALLTVVGYSLNDTIVVFDRIRENLAKPIAKRGTYIETLNRAINETLPRTILTGVTTLVTLLALLLFGGPVIRDFSLVLILGIIIGTFSSIFVASPVLHAIEQKWPHRAPSGGSAAGARRRRDPAPVR